MSGPRAAPIIAGLTVVGALAYGMSAPSTLPTQQPNVIPPSGARASPEERKSGDANPIMQKMMPEARNRAAAATDEAVSKDKYDHGKSQA